MTPAFAAALAIFLYLFGGVVFAYITTLIAMRSPDWDSGRCNTWGPGLVLFISIFWPLTIFGTAPMVGIVLAQLGPERKRLKAEALHRLEAEVFGK